MDCLQGKTFGVLGMTSLGVAIEVNDSCGVNDSCNHQVITP